MYDYIRTHVGYGIYSFLGHKRLTSAGNGFNLIPFRHFNHKSRVSAFRNALRCENDTAVFFFQIGRTIKKFLRTVGKNRFHRHIGGSSLNRKLITVYLRRHKHSVYGYAFKPIPAVGNKFHRNGFTESKTRFVGRQRSSFAFFQYNRIHIGSELNFDWNIVGYVIKRKRITVCRINVAVDYNFFGMTAAVGAEYDNYAVAVLNVSGRDCFCRSSAAVWNGHGIFAPNKCYDYV